MNQEVRRLVHLLNQRVLHQQKRRIQIKRLLVRVVLESQVVKLLKRVVLQRRLQLIKRREVQKEQSNFLVLLFVL